MIVWSIMACTTPEPAQAPPVPDHAGEWEALLRAAARDDRTTVRVMARDLSLGPAHDESDGASAVGAGLGFLQVATDGADLGLGLSKAAAGCASCHTERGVSPPDMPAPSHAGALTRAGWGAVWGQPSACPTEAPPEVCAAWGRLHAVVETCQGCHAAPEVPAAP